MDGGVEGFLYLHLALAVSHTVVADVELEVPGVGDDHLGLGLLDNYQIIEISQSLDDPVATQGSTAPMIYHHTNTIEEKSSRNHHPNKDI